MSFYPLSPSFLLLTFDTEAVCPHRPILDYNNGCPFQQLGVSTKCNVDRFVSFTFLALSMNFRLQSLVTLPIGRSSPRLNITHTTAEFTRYLTGDMPRVLRLWRSQNWNYYEIEAIVKGKQTRKNLLGPGLVLRSVVLFCCYYC